MALFETAAKDWIVANLAGWVRDKRRCFEGIGLKHSCSQCRIDKFSGLQYCGDSWINKERDEFSVKVDLERNFFLKRYKSAEVCMSVVWKVLCILIQVGKGEDSGASLKTNVRK